MFVTKRKYKCLEDKFLKLALLSGVMMQTLSDNGIDVDDILDCEMDEMSEDVVKPKKKRSNKAKANECDICGRHFKSENGVRIHVSKVH